ncbi:class E sortase [Streptomyces sp. NBC_00467]|uniref:class E sortase n=1 Tax=Streptomyces sp. NBC_00467 TaxID=2975752 RepID=UPI002E19C2CD
MSAGRPGDEYDPLTDPTPPEEWERARAHSRGQADTQAYLPPQAYAPAQEQPQAYPQAPAAPQRYSRTPSPGPQGHPQQQSAPRSYEGLHQAQNYGQYPSSAAEAYAETYRQDWYGQQETAPLPGPAARPAAAVRPEPESGRFPRPFPGSGSTPGRDEDDETVGLLTSDTRRAEEAPAGPGRAERRRAAKGRGRRRPEAPGTSAAPGRPLSRVEARRAARAAKDSPAVVASRAIGELFISFGVLLLLFVTYQLWWTNIRAGQLAGTETSKIQEGFAKGRQPGAFEPGQGFAIMYIPKLDVVVPIAEGINKNKVLDRGMVGHYGEGKLKTAMPSDKAGNFAVAGHRNTHGEPFRYINRLRPGDPIVVETQDAYYTYKMANILPQTSPSNIGVIAPVPAGSGFAGPGRYITLTTCTPEFTSTYRMIVWGKMVEERPRSQGKPDALVG